MELERMRRLIAQAQKGHEQARSQLVEENMPLVHSIANRFRERGLEYEDLIQIGSLGLLRAILDFNLEYDVRFSTYAVPKIMGEIRQHLRRSAPMRVSRTLKALASKAIAAKDNLAQDFGRNPSITEIAAFLNVEKEEIVAALDSVAPVYSLQAPLANTEDEGRELQDFIPARHRGADNFFLIHALEKLESQERQLILLRYFAEKSQREVAEQLGISQAQVSRLEARIIRQLRHEL